jgi:hypothetical protein
LNWPDQKPTNQNQNKDDDETGRETGFDHVLIRATRGEIQGELHNEK